MATRTKTKFGISAVLGLVLAAAAAGYIHFPPPTLSKMCQESHHIRVLTVQKFDREKGVVVFDCAETLKDGKSQITAHKLVVRPDATGTKPVLDWLKEGKQAVMFSIEGKDREAKRAIAYVFIDDYCFSADYSPEGRFWLLLRGEPGMSACYHGPAEALRGLVADVLKGKAVTVPTKEPAGKEDREVRNKEVNEALEKNRCRK